MEKAGAISKSETESTRIEEIILAIEFLLNLQSQRKNFIISAR